MKPLSLSLQGIGPYRERAEIDFEALQSPVAVVAGYGSGKSFLLEGILFALYGRGGWYSGSIHDALTQGGTGDAHISLVFELAGAEYEIRRVVGSSHTASVYRSGSSTVAGPKVTDVAQWVEAHIGTWETAASTWYLAQSRVNDLCGQPGESQLVARRRAAFNELLGIAGLEELAERLRTERRVAQAQIEDLEAQLAGEGDLEAKVEEAKRILFVVQGELGWAEIDAKALMVRQGAASEALSRSEAELAESQRELDGVRARIKEALDWQRRLQEAETRVRVLSDRVTALAGAHEQVLLLEEAKGTYASLSVELEARLAWEQASRDWAADQARRKGLAREIEALSSGLTDAATQALAPRVPELEKALESAKAERDVQEKAVRLYLAHREKINAEAILLRRRQEELEARVSKRPETPFGTACDPCPLMVEWADLPKQIEAVVQTINLARARADALVDPGPPKRIDEATRELFKARQAANDVARSKQAEAKIFILRSEDRPMAKPVGPEPANPRARMDQVRQEVERLASAPDRARALDQANDDLGEAKAKLAEAERSAADFQIEVLQGQETSLSGAIEGARTERIAAQKAAEHARTAVEQANKAIRQLHTDVGRAQASLEATEKAAQAQAERKAKHLSLCERRDTLTDLVECFGPKGVRQILIDSAAPELEAIADELFELATEGRMRLKIATQKLLKDGSVAEDFGILIKDERGERDAVAHSGGELQLIAILFRIAVSLWIGRLRGRKPDCLFLDEAFDRLGAQGAEDLLRALDGIADRFGLICVVTHDELIADRMRSKVRVVKGASGARIVV